MLDEVRAEGGEAVFGHGARGGDGYPNAAGVENLPVLLLVDVFDVSGGRGRGS